MRPSRFVRVVSLSALVAAAAGASSAGIAATPVPATASAPAAGTGAGATVPPAARDGWPDTPAGAAARRWVDAFSKGETAMRQALTELLAPESLATRGLDARMETYRESRERFGTLVLATVEKSAPAELEATLLAADLSRHRFVFKTQPASPYKLLSVGRMELQPGGHGFNH